jgi:RecB family exonuclease
MATPIAALLDELDRVTRANPYDRKVIVGVRPAEGRELLRGLSLSGRAWVGWESWSLRQLAHSVVGVEIAEAGLRTADSFDVMALVDQAIDVVEASGEAGPFGGAVPGAYRDPIRRTVETLRLADLDAARVAAAAGGDPKLRMLAAVLAAYERALAERRLLDGPALLGLAADALTADVPGADRPGTEAAGAGGAAALPDGRLYLLPGLGLRGEGGRLVRALLGRGATVLAADAVVGLPAPPARLEAPSPGGSGPLSRLHAARVGRGFDAGADHGIDAGDGIAAPPPAIDLFAAATPADELREVIRRVIALGARWDQVEIVATDPLTYGTALDGLARRLDIPVSHSEGLPLTRTRVGRAADAYFRWIADGFPIDPIRQLLESGDLSPLPADLDLSGDVPSPAALARRLRRLRIGWGYDRYLPALDRAIAAAERAGTPRNGDGDEEAGLVARDRERHELRWLRALLAPILAATPRPASRQAAWADRTSPARLAEGLRELLARVPPGDQVENTARTVLVERLERARSTLTRETGWLAATAILRSRLKTSVAATSDGGRLSPWTSSGGHVHLSDIAMGGLAGRPHTFVVGLAAGAVGGGGTDPLLTDSDRARLNRSLGSAPGSPAALPTTAERIEESRYALAAMLARLRGRVTLSYAAWDMAEGRTIGPSPELLQALRLREGDPSLTYEDLRGRLGRLACAVPAPGSPLTALADDNDVWLRAMTTADGPLRDGRPAVRAAHPGLDRGLAALDASRGDRLTPHHGLLPADPAMDPLAGDAVLSASRLETLGKCPLQYFYRYVLSVRPVRDPEYDPERWLDALERGSLLHDVYERALGERPAAMDYADRAFQDHTLAILDEEVRRMIHRLPAPNDAVLRAERDALEADVRSFVAMVRDQRPRVVRTELAFGPDDPEAEGEVELEVPDGLGVLGELGVLTGLERRGRRLRLRGRVDRLDALDGGGLRVVDYKTGRVRGYHPAIPFDGGRRLQHLLYALAVERLRPGERVELAEYHFPTTRGENRMARYARADLEPGHDVLAALLDLARQGRFLATTDPDDCRFCDFRDVCRVRTGEWGGVESPRADWAKAHASGVAEYGPLVRLRSQYGGDR